LYGHKKGSGKRKESKNRLAEKGKINKEQTLKRRNSLWGLHSKKKAERAEKWGWQENGVKGTRLQTERHRKGRHQRRGGGWVRETKT